MRNWKAWLAALLAAGVILYVCLDFPRVKSDFWPPDRSFIAPNIVASVVQWAMVLIAAALLWPPTRRAIHHYITGHVNDLKAHVAAEHAKLHAKLDASHKLLHHVIVNSKSIPNEVPGLDPKYQPKT